MWKKIFYGASKQVANDVSRAVGNQMKKQMRQDKEQRIKDNYKQQIIDEYEQDFEKQREVEEIDERLAYLISTNRMCNHTLSVLENPFEKMGLIELILDEIGDIRLTTYDIMAKDDFENEYFSNLINDTVAPFTTLSNILFGDSDEDEESIGILGLLMEFIESENSDFDGLQEVLDNAMYVVNNLKDQIKDVFEETKRGQIVSYYVNGETGEVDFGNYTVYDLD